MTRRLSRKQVKQPIQNQRDESESESEFESEPESKPESEPESEPEGEIKNEPMKLHEMRKIVKDLPTEWYKELIEKIILHFVLNEPHISTSKPREKNITWLRWSVDPNPNNVCDFYQSKWSADPDNKCDFYQNGFIVGKNRRIKLRKDTVELIDKLIVLHESVFIIKYPYLLPLRKFPKDFREREPEATFVPEFNAYANKNDAYKNFILRKSQELFGRTISINEFKEIVKAEDKEINNLTNEINTLDIGDNKS